MLKALLADDEILDLEGMKQFIPWEELGITIVDAVDNGYAACHIIEQQHIDILVTDVHMPNMTGLELARRALEVNKEIRIIFVSGYQDFNYVKQALSLNAVSYVLKPMDDEELIESLRKVKEEIMQERLRQEAELDYKQMLPMAKNEFLLRVMQQGSVYLQTEGVARLIKYYGMAELQWPLRVALIEIDDMNAMKELEPCVMDRFFEAVIRICEWFQQDLNCRVSPGRLVILMNEAYADTCTEAIYASVQSGGQVSITVGMGSAVSDLNMLEKSYKQAIRAVDHKMFLGKGKLICYEEVRQTPEMEDACMVNVRLDALFQAMSSYDLVNIHDEIERLFESVSNLHSHYMVRNLATYIVFRLEQHLQAEGSDVLEQAGIELYKLDILHQFDTIRDIRSWLVRKVYEISELLHSKASSKNTKLIREIMKVMQSRMAENLTLKDIAHQFSFSPNYLGRLFKEDVGKTFSEVLIQLRMDAAKAMLDDPKMKIYEVADQVGYRYLPYFSKQFKETFGMSPMEWRKSKH